MYLQGQGQGYIYNGMLSIFKFLIWVSLQIPILTKYTVCLLVAYNPNPIGFMIVRGLFFLHHIKDTESTQLPVPGSADAIMSCGIESNNMEQLQYDGSLPRGSFRKINQRSNSLCFALSFL